MSDFDGTSEADFERAYEAGTPVEVTGAKIVRLESVSPKVPGGGFMLYPTINNFRIGEPLTPRGPSVAAGLPSAASEKHQQQTTVPAPAR